MSVLRFARSMVMGVALLAGCGDSNNMNSNDMAMQSADLSASRTASCLTTALCAQACASQTCIDNCLAEATPAALSLFTALTGCGYGVCIAASMHDGGTGDGGATASCSGSSDQSPACQACVGSAVQTAACSTQLNACLSN